MSNSAMLFGAAPKLGWVLTMSRAPNCPCCRRTLCSLRLKGYRCVCCWVQGDRRMLHGKTAALRTVFSSSSAVGAAGTATGQGGAAASSAKPEEGLWVGLLKTALTGQTAA